MAIKETLAYDITVNNEAATASVGSFKKQLREANNELLNMASQFGEASNEALNAAKKVAKLKDSIGDAKALADTFNPDKKFVALGGALQGATAGFSALQGAMGLFGSEGKEVEKALLKVQSAMALQQGISGIAGAMDSFKMLGNEIKGNVTKAFSTLKGAIAATGIGLLVVGIGLLITNFEEVKKAMLNLIPGLSKVADFFGKMIDAVTDFVGVTSEADRALEALNQTTNDRNKVIDQQMKVLGAMGNKEGEIHKLRQERAANEVELLLAKTKRTKEEDDKITELNTQRTVNEIENNKRIQKERDEQRKIAEAARLKEQQHQDELNKQKADQAKVDNKLYIKSIEDAKQSEDIKGKEKIQIKAISDAGIISTTAMTEKQVLDIEKASAEEKKREAKILFDQRIAMASDSLNILSEIVGKESAAGKAMAISSALINTYLGISAGVKLGFPAAIPAVLAAAVTGFKAVKNIIATKVPGGGGGSGGGSVPSMGSMEAPIKPQAQTTTLSTQSINQIGVASSRAFVLETDVTNNQERIQRLNRAARIN